MTELRPLMFKANRYDVSDLLMEWRWRIPPSGTPLFVSAFGDWVFGHPDGSLWALSVLEGTYQQVARNSSEYNTLNKSPEWLDDIFIASWLSIAAGNGLEPGPDECLGWKLHPLLGGKFEVSNMQLFSMRVYQSLMGQLHRQLQAIPEPPRDKKPWYKVW
ncbi:T6SS immunity protein Tdi1 domain-containing protein [Variovorax paradoxus]|uniref:T6SS immunity protein Tdi1 domain-containing protein n=1 Tax=Variovorax paradoxus TaxID=34073 RepID=UPI003ECC6490